MSSFSGFGQDVFVSYTHIDDQPMDGEVDGWVTRFDRSLRVRIAQWLGSNAQVWRDQKLARNDELTPTLIDTVADTAVFLMVLSPRYRQSTWCLREFHTFCEGAARHHGLNPGNKSRIFKVLKMPVDVDDQPAEAQDQIGYEFYIQDGGSRRPSEFSQDAGDAKDPRYWQRLDDVAYDIAELLKALPGNSPDANPTIAGAPPVYLASTASDVESVYLQIKRELQQRGHEVLPDRMLPLSAEAAREEVASMLKRCKLAIHLLGANYGVVPEGSEQSLTEIQHRVAANHARAHADFPRLIWTLGGTGVADQRQRALLELIATDPVALDVLETGVDELKASIFRALSPPEPAVQDEPELEQADCRVYVIFQEEDIEAVSPILDVLYEARIEYDYPQFEGDEGSRQATHERLLEQSSGVILFHGGADETSFRDQWETVRNAPGAAPTAVIIGPPLTPSKRLFRTREADVIRGYDEPPVEAVQSFLTSIRP